jgi:hypothetical protein
MNWGTYGLSSRRKKKFKISHYCTFNNTSMFKTTQVVEMFTLCVYLSDLDHYIYAHGHYFDRYYVKHLEKNRNYDIGGGIKIKLKY